MITNSPWAALMPPISALPYPFLLTGTTRAPSSAAMACEPSLLPLSATMISADRPSVSIACCAFWMQAASVSASSRHGITIETATGRDEGPDCCLGDRCATLIAHQPNAEATRRLRGKEMTPTDRLSRTATSLAANCCPFERFPRGRRKEYLAQTGSASPKVSSSPTEKL